MRWRIHPGAHKTGTTHVQDLLALRSEELAGLGIDCPTRGMLRKARFARFVSPAKEGFGLKSLLMPARRAIMPRRVRALGKARLTLVSEEQILGLSDGLLVPEFYPNAALRVRNLRKLVGGEPAALFLSVRNPAHLIPSAYAQCLRAGFPRRLPGMEEIRRRTLAAPPSWTHLVRRIREAFPEASLAVWTLENYTKDPGSHLDTLIGRRLGGWPELAPPSGTRALSAATIGRILSLDPGLSDREHIARCATLASQDEGGAPYRPFTAEETAALTSAYAADLGDMEREFPGVLLPPHPTPA